MPGSKLFTTAVIGTAVAIALFILGAANVVFADVGMFIEGAAFMLGLLGIAVAIVDAVRHMGTRPRPRRHHWVAVHH